ncbi:MAG: M48 family metallopeptidase [Proteobacteria bacterium]|nr:M48 family metallopeptidase [Pseudomonadota bacterium]
MKYEAKVIPEGINTSRQNPLKELFLLITASLSILALIIVLLAFMSDFLIGFIPPETESRWFGKQSIELERFGLIPEDQESYQPVEQYLHALIERLKSDEYSNFEFTITLYKHEIPNAFIVPGGHIFISTALLKNVDSENGLAMVLAHEMAHQYKRHPLRSTSRGIIIVVALAVLLGSDADGWLYQIFSETATISLLAFSREQEREADEIALQSLIEYYGHALGSTEFFNKISNLENLDSRLPVFYQSHPGTAERIEFLQEFIDQATGETTPLPDFVRNIPAG